MAFGLKKKKEFWHYDFQIDGERYAGSTRLRERRDALAYCRDYHRRIILGEAKLLRDTPTLEATCKAWLETNKPPVMSKGHYRSAKQWFNNHFIPAMGHLSLHQIDTKTVELQRNNYLATHSAHSANSWLAYLKLVFKWALNRNELNAMPWNVKRIPLGVTFKALVPAGKVSEYLEAARKECSTQVYCAVGVALLMGMRMSEIARMRWDRFSEDGNAYLVTEVGGVYTKNKRARTVPVPERLKPIFKALKDSTASEWVFPSENVKKHHSVSWLKKPIRYLGEQMGIPGLSPHKLRASWATNALDVANPKDVQMAGGWQQAETMLKYYAKPDMQRLKDVLDSLG